MAQIVGTDVGGTFTDVVHYDAVSRSLRYGKGLTTYGRLVDGVLAGIAQVEIPCASIDVLKHGTTQVINTLLERKGARTALITTRGFRDTLEIGRASRPLPFDLAYRRDPPLVERALRFEVSERLDATGETLIPLDFDELGTICARLRDERIEAAAISFVNAYIDPRHENEAAAFVRARLPGLYVTTGTELSREWFEYERGSTAAANAYVGPRAARYLAELEAGLARSDFRGALQIMGSHGGVLSVRRACEQPVALVESGPIGGCMGAAAYARALGIQHLVAFDMGGTTAKCALVENGQFDVQPTYYVGGYERGLPLRTPVLDIVEVGTGGGSIAHVDARGRLHVGPRSAGSEPGPACFGRGGTAPTVTDANLVLDRIGSGVFLQGALMLDAPAARDALVREVGERLGYLAEDLDRVASGVLDLANAQMGAAIKEITVERGKDIRDFILFAFGGGGPLHASDLARELRIRTVLVPPEPGNFSALGMLFAPARIDEVRSLLIDLAEAGARLPILLSEMESTASAGLQRDFQAEAVEFERQVDMRFRGQRHTIRIPLAGEDGPEELRARFLERYAKRYGRADPSASVELTGVRVTAIAATAGLALEHLRPKAAAGEPLPLRHRTVFWRTRGERIDTPVWNRRDLPEGFIVEGPAILEEFGATTLVAPGDRAIVGSLGELAITIGAREAA